MSPALLILSRSTGGYGHGSTKTKDVDAAAVAPQLLVTVRLTVADDPARAAAYIFEVVLPEPVEPSPNDQLNDVMVSRASPESDVLASKRVVRVPSAKISPDAHVPLAVKAALGVGQVTVGGHTATTSRSVSDVAALPPQLLTTVSVIVTLRPFSEEL